MYSQFLKTILHFSLALGLFISAASLVEQQALANTQISVEKAKEIALKHANLAGENVFFSDIELDSDFGRVEYEIEFFFNNNEYEYDIDAVSGKVKSFSQKKLKNTVPQTGNMVQYMSEAQAKEIALKHSKISAKQLNHSNIKFEMEDGQAVYDIDLYANNAKYEYEINASTGEILEFGKE